MVSSVFAFLASYSAQKYGDGESIIYRDAPSVWLGISFIIVSSLIYYIGYSRIIGDYNIIYLILLFYVGGGLIVYMNIDKRLQKIE